MRKIVSLLVVLSVVCLFASDVLTAQYGKYPPQIPQKNMQLNKGLLYGKTLLFPPCKAGFYVVNASKLGSTPAYMNFCSSKIGEVLRGKTIKAVYICKIGNPIPQNACADKVVPEAGAPLESTDLAMNYSCSKDTQFTEVTCGAGFEPWEYGQNDNVCMEWKPIEEAGDECLGNFLSDTKCCVKKGWAYVCEFIDSYGVYPTLQSVKTACQAGSTTVNTSIEGEACCAILE